MSGYEILYADPPWSYRQSQVNLQDWDTGKKYSNHVTQHYPTMTLSELKQMPVSAMAADDSLLFMWATSPNLDIAIQLGEAWGFKYKTVAFVWDKQRTNYGFYTLSQCELCLVFKRGRIPARAAKNVRQFISEKLGKHSAKPHEVRQRIERIFPTHKKIELFARGLFPGWDAHGNECSTSSGEASVRKGTHDRGEANG